jgi:hypothetical protein
MYPVSLASQTCSFWSLWPSDSRLVHLVSAGMDHLLDEPSTPHSIAWLMPARSFQFVLDCCCELSSVGSLLAQCCFRRLFSLLLSAMFVSLSLRCTPDRKGELDIAYHGRDTSLGAAHHCCRCANSVTDAKCAGSGSLLKRLLLLLSYSALSDAPVSWLQHSLLTSAQTELPLGVHYIDCSRQYCSRGSSPTSASAAQSPRLTVPTTTASPRSALLGS